MDREIVFAVLLAVVGTVVVSSYYFGDSPAREQSTYAPEDIRYPIQQAEEKAKAKEAVKRRKVIAPPTGTHSGEDHSDNSTSQTDIEQPPAEEPELE